MKNLKKIKNILPIVAILLIGISVISTVSAGTQYNATATLDKSGKEFTFTVNNCQLQYFGNYLVRDSVVISIYDVSGNLMTFDVDWHNIAISTDGSSIVITLVKQDGLPSHAAQYNIQGDLGGDYVGSTFYAAGAGWAWGRTR